MGAPPNLSAKTTRAGSAMVLLSYLVLSAAWTWPTVRFEDLLPTRQFDLFPTLWMLGVAPDVGFGLAWADSAWPLGESLRRADSYVLFIVGLLTGHWVDPVLLASALVWIGPAINATFAERCAAQTFRIPRPWSWIAGVSYGFSGIAATALLEGHIHHLLNPWLPLLLSAVWRLRDGSTRWQAGIPAGVYWALALFTSGYFGVLGAMVIVVAALGRVTVPLVGTALVAVPAGLFYVNLFGAARQAAARASEVPDLWHVGTNSLAGLVASTPSLDLAAHSVGAPIGFAVFWLVLAAPIVLRAESGWRDAWAVALLMLLLTFGASFRLDPRSALSLWSPAALVTELPGVSWFRFPVRFAWLYCLFGGLIAARVARALATPLPLAGAIFTGLLVIGDAFVGPGMPWRLTHQIGAVPSAYDAAPDAPVLDLYALPADRSRTEGELRARGISCYYQTRHRRPILEQCIGTQVDSPREVVNAWLEVELFQADVDAAWVAEQLGRLGVGAVAVHADTYRPSDLAMLNERLSQALGAPKATSHDGGERVVLYTVPRVADAAPLKVWERMRGRVLGN